MAKDSVPEWSKNPNDNTQLADIPLVGSLMGPSQVPPAFRMMMAQLRANNDNFPSVGQLAQSRRRSRIINGAFQMSQENGNTAGNTHGYRPADGWAYYRTATGADSTVQRIQARTLRGSTDQLEHKTTTAKTTLAANDNCAITTGLEGSNVSDFEWGTARAKPVLFDFEVQAPAGTYCLHVSNYAGNRNYVSPVVIAANEANQPVRKTVRVPGDTTGTWETGNACSVIVDFVLAAGNGLTGAGDAWTSSAIVATPAQRNILDTAGNTVRFGDVALYADNDNAGSPPAWELPSLEETERWCHRYYWKIAGGAFVPVANGMFFNSASWTGVFTFPVTMRTTPQVSVSSQTGFEAAGVSILPTTAMGIANPSNQTVRVQATVAGATAGQGAFLRFGSAGGWIAFNARLLG